MRKNLWLVLVLAALAGYFATRPRAPEVAAQAAGDGTVATLPADRATPEATGTDDSLSRAIAARAEEVPVTGRGVVVKLLRDDLEGNPHQRILVRVAGGGTVLLAHNIALSPRVAPLAEGDTLEFAGDYVWNDKGGVVHWTHPDPQGRHRAGWIRRVR